MKQQKRFMAVKRTALDGKSWWVVYDKAINNYSHYICWSRYQTKKDCEYYINYCLNKYKNILVKGV